MKIVSLCTSNVHLKIIKKEKREELSDEEAKE